MPRGPVLETKRLRLRRWRTDDLRPFAALNSDPVVMEHFPSMGITTEETGKMIAHFEYHFEEHGFGLWAVEIKWARSFIGFCGLAVPGFAAPFMPAVEIGWRFAKEHWGSGYATEAARAAMDFGFDEAELDEIVSFTIPANTRSVSVMERLGMTHNTVDDFDHPRFPDDERIRHHVLYRITPEKWAKSNAG
jgi:ribosomal-protein-alanine N-acetyltransferase